MDLDVISGAYRYAAAGILDAMAKKIEMLNGRPAMEPDTLPLTYIQRTGCLNLL